MELIHQDPETIHEPNGSAGGPDYNLSSDYSKRFTWRAPDGTYRTVTFTTYVQARDADGDLVSYDEWETKKAELAQWETDRAAVPVGEDEWTSEVLDRWEAEHPRPLRYTWEDVTEEAVHTDPEEIDDADYEYGEGSYEFFTTLEDAEDGAEAAVDRLSVAHFDPQYIGT